MPYITPEQREDLDTFTRAPQTAGELNYWLTCWLMDYYKKHPSYQTINDIVGVLECAKLEFYRRVVVPYEDNKIKENGDVY